MNEKWSWGVIATAVVATILLFALPFWSEAFRDFFKILQPVSTFFIGAVVAFITIRNYLQTRGSKFVVNYALFLNDRATEWGPPSKRDSPFEHKDRGENPMPFISKIYIRNEKNKVEAIEKIFLQIYNKVIIPLVDYGNKPLLIEPFNHVIENLDPVTFYFIEGEDTKDYYVFDWNSGFLRFHKKRSRIIIQTQDKVSVVKANIKPREINIKNSTMLKSVTWWHGWRNGYERILSHNVRKIYSIPIAEKTSNRDLLADQSLSTDEYKMLGQSEEFGIELVMLEGNDEYFANYYFLTKDKEKIAIEDSPSWWNDFCKQYDSFLCTPYTNHSFESLLNFLHSYLQKINIETLDNVGEVHFKISKPPRNLQEILIEKKPSLKSRLSRFFFWKKKRTKRKAKKQKK